MNFNENVHILQKAPKGPFDKNYWHNSLLLAIEFPTKLFFIALHRLTKSQNVFHT